MKESVDLFPTENPPRVYFRSLVHSKLGMNIREDVVPMLADQDEDPDFPPQERLYRHGHSSGYSGLVYAGFFLFIVGAGYVVLSTLDYAACSKTTYGCTWERGQ